jgi:hypothetical protein
MTEVIDEKVKVGMSDSPKWVKWKGRIHEIDKIGLHYTFREGRVLYHMFSVSTNTLAMKLRFDTETLDWRLMEVESAI